jgi:nicotinamidase-related amidase
VVEAARVAGVTVMHAPQHLRQHQSRSHPAQQGITTIVLGGFLTNCCVESTMRTGYEHGYQVLTLTGCTAASSPEQYDNAIAYDFRMFSQPTTSEDFIGELP